MKRILIQIVLAILLYSTILPQEWGDYLAPEDTTINKTEELTIFGRLNMAEIPAEYGADTNFTAKLHISESPQEPRFSPKYIIDATFDKYIGNKKQFRAIVNNIPVGNYMYCYMYYIDGQLKEVGGVPNTIPAFIPGQLTVEIPTFVDDKELVSFSNKLFQNYPNPFNPTTTISYSIFKQSKITLVIYDVLGRVINTIVDRIEIPGQYSVEWNANKYPSGVYFYKLKAGELMKSKKMLLIK